MPAFNRYNQPKNIKEVIKLTMIKATINNIDVEVPEGTTILWAAKKANFNIPTLCFHPDLKPGGQCGVCVVEIEGIPGLKRSCMTPVGEGFKVRTHTPKVMSARKQLVETDSLQS